MAGNFGSRSLTRVRNGLAGRLDGGADGSRAGPIYQPLTMTNLS